MPNNYNPNSNPTQSNTMTSKELKRTVNGGPNKAVTKKEGAGGKGSWGKVGAYDDATAAMDSGDPNYDSESEGGIVLEATG